MIRVACVACLVLRCGGVISNDEHDASVIDVAPQKEAAIDVSVVDVAASETSTDAGAVTPIAMLDNVVLWLDANALVKTDSGGHVTAWGDRSTSKNDALAASFYAPTLSASGIGGLPSIHFDASSTSPLYLEVADAPSLQWGQGDYLVAVVARFTNDPKSGPTTGAPNLFWKSSFQGQSGAGVSLWGNVPFANGTISDGLLLLEDSTRYVVDGTPRHDGVARAFMAIRSAGEMQLWVNGKKVAAQMESVPVDVSAPSEPVVIGALNLAYYRLFGDIAEIVACKGPTSSSDVDALAAYFQAKYSL
jgi:hypothetical protein